MNIRTLLARMTARNVDGIVSSINRSVGRLEVAAQRHDRTVRLLETAADRLIERANAHDEEAVRARRVAENFRRLTK